jgi:hypothetical protein
MVEGGDLPISGRSTRKGGGRQIIKLWKGRKRNDNGKLMLTKLMLPRHQVTLSQIPPPRRKCGGQRANHISKRVLEQTPLEFLWPMSQPATSVDLSYQLLSESDNPLECF